MKPRTIDVLPFIKEFNYISLSDLENILEYLDDEDLLNEYGKQFRTTLWELFIHKENNNIESWLNLPYHYSITIDCSTRSYSISVEELPGCSAWGYTLDEAYRNIKISMRLWFEQAIKQNLPIPKPNKDKQCTKR